MSSFDPQIPRPPLSQYIADALSASVASLFVSPIVTAVDKALAENASGKQALFPSFMATMQDCIKKPFHFIKSPSFRWIWAIYAGTYFTANIAQTACDRQAVDSALPKWLASSSFNTVSSILKDRSFAQQFGAGAIKAVPMKSLGIWTMRDCLSMYAFITLPPIVGKAVGDVTGNHKIGHYSAQLLVPLLFCYIVTPIHLWGYDVYNNPNHTIRQTANLIKKDYRQSVSFMMIRSLPPWTVGIIANTELRTYIGDLLRNDV